MHKCLCVCVFLLCSIRYKILNFRPASERRKWTKDEDASLVGWVEKVGNDYMSIAKQFDDRTNYECQIR